MRWKLETELNYRRKHDMTTLIIAMMIATLLTARKIAKLKHD